MKLYLIPAYQETIRNQGYRRIITAAEKAGYGVEILNLQIQNRKFNEVIAEGIEMINRSTSEPKAILGFSTGALIAYQIATKIRFEKAFFCSLSPLLEDDIPKTITPYVRYFGKETVLDLKKQKYGTSLANETFFFTGDHEGRKLISRTKTLAVKNDGNLIVIKDNDHELNRDYTKEISLKL
ncbi:hypothetical protein H6778_00240 [Candidatus Nomurabacteria bacterium]|uniref:Alpha/beta hydrolase n=1 Tax=candidate division WWE3 bacterium TaxID=2053526 RepID=A0A955LW25_UNCKA|nr:hypothetical protein [candidate division WWE3 bacterium]MCB9812076.1 hypothetical protein [Candidatus Nomurabacteria bacterium]